MSGILIECSGNVQRRAVQAVLSIQVRSRVQQGGNHRGNVVVRGGEVKRRKAGPILALQVCARIQQSSDERRIVVESCGVVQRQREIEVGCRHVQTGVNQLVENADIGTVPGRSRACASMWRARN